MGNLPPTVGVTGATGFIGSALCRHLRRADTRVRALVRDPARAQSLKDIGVDLVAGNLHDHHSLELLVEGCEALVHCAGSVRGCNQQDYDYTNVEGLRNLLTTISRHKPGMRIIMLSSLAAREPELSWYARSKYRGEQLLRNQDTVTNWTLLRPPPVYGPGDKEMLPIFKCMSLGVAPVAGDIHARISIVHVDDLVTAITACLQQPATRGMILYPDDGHEAGYNWLEMAALAAKVWQRSVRPLALPPWLLNGVARLNLLSARIFGYAPMLTPAKLRELRHPDWVVDASNLRAHTTWSPGISLQDGMQRIREAAL